jgi:hypothetical protein
VVVVYAPCGCCCCCGFGRPSDNDHHAC